MSEQMRPTTIKFTSAQLDSLRAYAEQHKTNPSSVVRDGLAAIIPNFPHDNPQHGGQRFYQCEQCHGWNVGKQEDGSLTCADCGWLETDAVA